MDEATAKTKWCPFARVGSSRSGLGAMNRLIEHPGLEDQPPIPNLCIASACMAWRWHDPWTSQTEEGHGGDLVIRLKRKPGEPKVGFCGLAGGPLG